MEVTIAMLTGHNNYSECSMYACIHLSPWLVSTEPAIGQKPSSQHTIREDVDLMFLTKINQTTLQWSSVQQGILHLYILYST